MLEVKGWFERKTTAVKAKVLAELTSSGGDGGDPAEEDIPVYSLQRMVVLPDYQGKRVGSNCLGNKLQAVLVRSQLSFYTAPVACLHDTIASI
jgi:GNAT superfamily N-acetyltransferase